MLDSGVAGVAVDMPLGNYNILRGDFALIGVGGEKILEISLVYDEWTCLWIENDVFKVFSMLLEICYAKYLVK